MSAPIALSEELLARLFYTLSVTLKAGLPLPKTLDLLAQTAEHPQIRDVAKLMQEKLNSGLSFTETLRNSLDLENKNTFLRLLGAGEQAGALEPILERLYQYLTQDLALRRKIRQAAVYPVLLFLTLVAIMAALVFCAAPFVQILEGSHHPLTRILFWEIHTLQRYWFVALLALAGIVFFIRGKTMSQRIGRWLSRLPLWGKIQLWYGINRFALLMETYSVSGLSILQGLVVALKAIDHPVLSEDSIQQINQAVYEEDKTIAEALEEHAPKLPAILRAYLQAAESTGAMDKLCRLLGEWAALEVEQATQQITLLIEPATLLVIGVFIGFHIVAFMLGLQEIMPL